LLKIVEGLSGSVESLASRNCGLAAALFVIIAPLRKRAARIPRRAATISRIRRAA
jgi:hypothetical protein